MYRTDFVGKRKIVYFVLQEHISSENNILRKD